MNRSVKNNNPGKLPKGPKLYIGERIVTTDYPNCQFEDIVWGYRAMLSYLVFIINLNNNTVRKVVTRWEPRSKAENDKVVKFITENTDLKENEFICADDKIKLIKIVCAITHYENDFIPDERIVLKAYDLLDFKNFL